MKDSVIDFTIDLENNLIPVDSDDFGVRRDGVLHLHVQKDPGNCDEFYIFNNCKRIDIKMFEQNGFVFKFVNDFIKED